MNPLGFILGLVFIAVTASFTTAQQRVAVAPISQKAGSLQIPFQALRDTVDSVGWIYVVVPQSDHAQRIRVAVTELVGHRLTVRSATPLPPGTRVVVGGFDGLTDQQRVTVVKRR